MRGYVWQVLFYAPKKQEAFNPMVRLKSGSNPTLKCVCSDVGLRVFIKL